MSGGSYDYFYIKVEEIAHRISTESCCSSIGYSRPALRKAFKEHLLKVAEILHAIEWNDSCDGDSTENEKIEALLGPNAELQVLIAEAFKAKEALDVALASKTRPGILPSERIVELINKKRGTPLPNDELSFLDQSRIIVDYLDERLGRG